MALISTEESNEQSQNTTKSTNRNKTKQVTKKHTRVKANLIEKVRQSPVGFESHGICQNLPIQLYLPYTFPTMLSTYPLYNNFACSVTPEWTPVIPLQSIVYGINLPVVVNPVQILATQVSYHNVVPQVIPPVIPTIVEEIASPCYHEPLAYCDDKVQNIEYHEKDDLTLVQYVDNCGDNKETRANIGNTVSISYELNQNANANEANDVIQNLYEVTGDPLEFYLTLPKELFPAARTLTVDPNPVIDVFCKVSDIQKHAPWILDLEFGVPNLPITRPLPTYNVKLNRISCKNAPEAIHPGFESCDDDFKEVFMFYYDSVISTWYRGYIILNNDNSVENFQSWLLLPAQMLGMCWS